MSVLAVIGLYVAGVIGAGFASGQELVIFFVRYGWAGMGGIILTLILLTLGVGITLELSYNGNIVSYRQLFELLSGGNNTIARGLDWIYGFFLFTGIAVMLAGCTAVNSHLGVLTAVLVFVILQGGTETVLKLGTPLAVILVFILSYISLTTLKGGQLNLSPTPWWSSLEGGFLYSAYNLGFSLALLVSVQQVLKSPQQGWVVGLIGNCILGTLLICLFLALGTLPQEQLSTAFPVGQMALALGPWISKLYQGTLWVAMYTTALANSLALVARITKNADSNWRSRSLLVCVGAYLFSRLGFSTLIKIAYPVLGLAGLWIIANLLRIKYV